MPTNVGTTTLVVRAFMGDFKKDIAREAGPAGNKAASTFGAAFKKTAGLALAGAFAVAAKGALELDTATRRAAASAGILESEMGAFRSQVVNLFKSNPTKSFDEIADTIGALKTDLGLTTEEAGKAAQAFLDFSKVARIDGTSAVKGLDDALDVFDLTAADSVRVMDLLVASNQRYGGSLQQRLSDLKTIGPALQGLNLTIEDAIGLENLFETAGLDASAAQRALNTAVKNLQPGQTFDDLIRQVSAIEDPTKRAQEAMRLFGVQGGKIGVVFRPGIDSIDDFTLSVQETADATTKAADIIDDSFANRITGAIRQVTGSLADLGADAAPVIQAIAGLGAIAGGARGLTTALAASHAGALGLIGGLGALGIAGGVVALAVLELADAHDNFNDRMVEVNQKVKDGTANLYDARAAIYATQHALVPTSAAVRDAARAWGELERAATEAARAHTIGTTATGLPFFTAAPPVSSAASGRVSGGSFGSDGSSRAMPTSVNVTVINPDREPASQSVDERLRILAATGII